MKAKKLFRFRLRSLIALMGFASIVCGYFSWNAKHFAAITELLEGGNKVQWKRENPSWLDKKLGIYRFDAVKRVEIWDPDSDLKALADLHSFEEFRSDHVFREFSSMYGHAENLKVFSMYDCPSEAAQFLRKTKSLEEFTANTWDDFDISWLAGNKNLKVLYVTSVCGGLHQLEKFPKLEYLNAPHQLNSLEALRHMTRLEHLDFSNSRVSSLEPIKGLKSFKYINFEDCPIPQAEIDAFLKSLPKSVKAYGSSLGELDSKNRQTKDQ